jgi:hypothetical protein
MGLIRLLNPFTLNITAPRHRAARALEELARAERARGRAARTAEKTRRVSPTASRTVAVPDSPEAAAIREESQQNRRDLQALPARGPNADDFDAQLAALNERVTATHAKAVALGRSRSRPA